MLRRRLSDGAALRHAHRHLTARVPSDHRPDCAHAPSQRHQNVQIKVEVINLFNRVQLRGNQMNTTQGNSAFGTIVSQGGFMRTTQVMFRYSW